MQILLSSGKYGVCGNKRAYICIDIYIYSCSMLYGIYIQKLTRMIGESILFLASHDSFISGSLHLVNMNKTCIRV